MRSDPRTAQALTALAQPIAEFRAMVRDALTRAEAFLASQSTGVDERAAVARRELGCFAEGHVDPVRFAVLFAPARDASPAAIATLERVIATLRGLIALGDAACALDVPLGGRLDAALLAAFGEIGQAFGAVILTDLIRTGRYDAARHDRFLDPMAFANWNSVERRVAPPIVVTVDGADLHASELTAFADGREKIVLVIRGACSPAPLARCITPGTFVSQATDCQDLGRVAVFDGPALAAIMPEQSASFVHNPSAGREAWQRLVIRQGGVVPKRAIAGTSVWQMREELALLADMARVPVTLPGQASGAASATGDVVDRIAAWLLGQAELPGT